MTVPSILAARDFDPAAHVSFFIGPERVGWIRRADVELLERWPNVFIIDAVSVKLVPALCDPVSASKALGTVIDMLAANNKVTGWRDEIYAIRNDFSSVPLAFIERAAARFFGMMTFAVHLNGVVENDDSAPRIWIARRSETKAVDPGMFDNMVAGGIGWGIGIEQTLVKECWEEAGIPVKIAATALRGRTAHLLHSLPEGTRAEQLFIYDVALPPDFSPCNQDGEVSEYRLACIDEVMQWIEAGEFTVDASVATLDWLLRSRWIDKSAGAGIETLFLPPVL